MKKIKLTVLLFFSFILIRASIFGQLPANDTVISCFVHIRPSLSGLKEPYRIQYFKLNCTDSIYNWESEKIEPLLKDEIGYLIKLNFPKRIFPPKNMVYCNAYFIQSWGVGGGIVDSINYGGIQLSQINLHLNSDPKGADVYLFPNRQWNQVILTTDWQHHLDDYWQNHVSTSSTNTETIIDQTVYVVIFKLGDKIEKRILKTLPQNVKKDQEVSVSFK